MGDLSERVTYMHNDTNTHAHAHVRQDFAANQAELMPEITGKIDWYARVLVRVYG